MIDLSPIHTKLIKQIIAKELPYHEIVVFGSRVSGAAKPYSDLDLAIISKDGLGKNKIFKLLEAFEESDLPFCIDVVDWNSLTESFREHIKESCESL